VIDEPVWSQGLDRLLAVSWALALQLKEEWLPRGATPDDVCFGQQAALVVVR
jgi:hypothetical protein